MNAKGLYWSVFFSATTLYILVANYILWIMFENIWACLVISVVTLPVFLKILRNYLENKKQQLIENEFYKMLSRVSMSMASGMILENSLKETISVDKKDYKLLRNDFEKMYRMLQNNYSIESVFKMLAHNSNNREIKTFCEILMAGSPMGINMTELIRYLSSAYRMRADTEGEIKRILNAPKYNNRIIIIMPFACMTLFRQLAPTYMDGLYTFYGRIVMIVVAVLLVFSWWLGERLGNISY